MPDDREKFEKRLKESNELHRIYRGGSIAFSATIITLCSAIIFGLAKGEIATQSQLRTIVHSILSGTVIVGVFIQYCFVKGYMHEARAMLDYATGENGKANIEWGKGTNWFTRLDRTTTWTCRLLVVGLILTAIAIGTVPSSLNDPPKTFPLTSTPPAPTGASATAPPLTFGFRWEALAAVGTFLAVCVALLPICQDAVRRKHQAKSLRLRLCSKLTLLRPSLGTVIQRKSTYPEAELTPEMFRAIVALIGEMMKESSILKAEEQDKLGVVMANLEVASLIYRTPALHPESAKNVLALLDETVKTMGKHGLLHGPIEAPWNSDETG